MRGGSSRLYTRDEEAVPRNVDLMVSFQPAATGLSSIEPNDGYGEVDGAEECAPPANAAVLPARQRKVEVVTQ
jgi:hypothetical protein